MLSSHILQISSKITELEKLVFHKIISGGWLMFESKEQNFPIQTFKNPIYTEILNKWE